MTETSTTPTPRTPCPAWCTTDHADADQDFLGHHAKVGEEFVYDGDQILTVHMAASIRASRWRNPCVSLGYTACDGSGSGAASLPPAEAPAVAGLLRALGHAEIADAIDGAVAILGGAS